MTPSPHAQHRRNAGHFNNTTVPSGRHANAHARARAPGHPHPWARTRPRTRQAAQPFGARNPPVTRRACLGACHAGDCLGTVVPSGGGAVAYRETDMSVPWYRAVCTNPGRNIPRYLGILVPASGVDMSYARAAAHRGSRACPPRDRRVGPVAFRHVVCVSIASASRRHRTASDNMSTVHWPQINADMSLRRRAASLRLPRARRSRARPRSWSPVGTGSLVCGQARLPEPFECRDGCAGDAPPSSPGRFAAAPVLVPDLRLVAYRTTVESV